MLYHYTFSSIHIPIKKLQVHLFVIKTEAHDFVTHILRLTNYLWTHVNLFS
jgi:hypothetical protein